MTNHVQPPTSPLKLAIIPSIVAGVFALIVAFISLQSGGKQAVDNAISKKQSEIEEMVQKQTLLKTGFIPGEMRSFAFGGGREDKAIKELRTLGWLECAGQDLSVQDYHLLYDRIGDIWGTANRGRDFYVPDLRGVFLRGWGDGANVDPEKGTRSASRQNGAPGNMVGSLQPDQVGPHQHRYAFTTNTTLHPAAGDERVAKVFMTTPTSTSGTTDAPQGSVETRPKNVYVMFCIYVGRPVLDTTPDGSRP